jgi:predicted DsbA family dithiol-disulfide isomerase
LQSALLEGHYTDRVLEDQHLAHQLGINSVPALFVRAAHKPLEEAQVLSGVHPYEGLRQVVERAMANCAER